VGRLDALPNRQDAAGRRGAGADARDEENRGTRRCGRRQTARRTRSARNCLLNIGRASRSRVKQGKDRMQQSYATLLSITGRVVGQAKRFVQEVASGVKRSACILRQAGIEAERKYLQTMVPRVQQVMRQTRERIFKDNPHSSGKIVSLFEAHTEIIRKGKASKPTEFGKMVKIQEAEQRIVTHYEVYDERPSDSDLLVPALDVHEQQFGRPPRLVAADAGFFSAHNEAAAHARGVKRVSVLARRPRRSSKRWTRTNRPPRRSRKQPSHGAGERTVAAGAQ
jgi:IS5 family transposase